MSQVAVEKVNNYEKGHTALHTIFVKHCIQTKSYKAAASIVEKPILNIAKSFEIEHDDYLAYILYSSFVLIALEVIFHFRFSLRLFPSFE